MRRELVLGVGLAVGFGGHAAAQFASDPPGKLAAPPARGFQPAPAPGFSPASPPTAAPATPAPAVVPAAPVAIDLQLALGADHPDLIRAEHGAYTIHVHSYSRPRRPDPSDPGPSARQLAEGLVAAIRQAQPRVSVYLFEYISNEKRAEAAAIAAARLQAASFLKSMDAIKRTSEVQGMTFMDDGEMRKLRYKAFNSRDQIGVFVGGFKTEDDAVQALKVVKKWAAPADTRLLDGAAMVRPANPQKPDGRTVIERSFLNPFATATVFPNPAAPRAVAKQTGYDPFVLKLNEGRPYSLFKATKSWTLGVKAFGAPLTFASQNDNPDLMRKGAGNGGDVLLAGAEQAEALAKAIREMKGPGRADGTGGAPLNLEAFVLHNRSGSIVTVGQFDAPDDPELVRVQRFLSGLKLNVTADRHGQQMMTNTHSVFGKEIVPMMIPKP